MAVQFDTDTVEVDDLDDRRLFSGADRPTEVNSLSDLQRNYCLNQWDRSDPKYVELANHVSPGWTIDFLNPYTGFVVEVTTVRQSSDGSRDFLVRLTSVAWGDDGDGLSDTSEVGEDPTVIWQRRQTVRLWERVDSLIEELLLGFANNNLEDGH